jgi:hypothetical protein
MDPTQQELFKVVVKYIHEGKYIELFVALLILYLPFFLAMVRGWFNRREVRKLYKMQLDAKDQEIERLATMVKELHNLNLRTKRK